MAENPALSGAAEGFKLTSGAGAAVGQGISTGQGWAQGKAQADMIQQHLTQQKEIHDQQKQEWRVKVLTQQHDEYKNLLTLADGQLKNDELKNFQEKWDQTPFAVDPSHISAAKDKTYAPDIARVLQELDSTVRISDPESFNNAVATGQYFGAKLDPTNLSKMSTGAKLLTAQIGAKARVDSAALTGGTRSQNANFRQTAAGQNQYDREIKPITLQLEGINRIQNIFQKIDSGAVKTNKQVRALLSEEEAKILTGKQNYAEGTTQRLAVDSYEARFKDFINLLSDEPAEDTISKGNLDQMKEIYRDMKESYHSAADRKAQQLLGGATGLEREAIIGRHKATQNSQGALSGGWQGPGVDLEGGEKLKPEPVKEEKPKESAKNEPVKPANTEILSKMASKVLSYPAGPERTAAVQKALKALKNKGDQYVQPFMDMIQQTTIGTK